MSEGYIRKRGKKWYYSFEIAKANGKRKRVELVAGDTREEAYDKLRDAITNYKRAGMYFEVSRISVADFFDYWFAQYVYRNLTYNTQINYLNIIDQYIKPKLGSFYLKALSPGALQHFIDEVSQEPNKHTHKPLAKHSVEIIYTVLKSAFRKAVYPYQFIKDNPMNYVEMPKYHIDPRKTREKLKIITLEQYQQILDMTPISHHFYMPLVIAFGTGMRRGEVCGLQWDMVDLEAGSIHVERNMIQLKKKDLPKEKREHPYKIEGVKTPSSYRTIYIDQYLIDELHNWRKRQMANRIKYGEYYDDTNFVCTHENGMPVTPSSIKSRCTIVSETLGFPFNFHSLRHTHATLLLENGAKEKEIQERLGHSRISTTLDTYSHVTRNMKKSTMNIFERIQNDIDHKHQSL